MADLLKGFFAFSSRASISLFGFYWVAKIVLFLRKEQLNHNDFFHVQSTTLHKEVKLTNLVVWIYAKMVEETWYWLVKVNEDLRKRKFCIFDWSVDFSKSYKNYCPKLFMWFRNIDNSKHAYIRTYYVNALRC